MTPRLTVYTPWRPCWPLPPRLRAYVLRAPWWQCARNWRP